MISLAGTCRIAGLFLLAAILGCGETPEGFVLDERLSLGATSDLSFSHQPRLTSITADHQRRTAAVLPVGKWSWRGRVPKGSRLVVGAAPAEAGELEDLVLSVRLFHGEKEIALLEERGEEGVWVDAVVDLAPWAGKKVTLEFAAALPGKPEGEIAWGPVALLSPSEVTTDKPNIVLIVVDTLRADHLSCYGYRRPTTPHIDEQLAARGVLVERAYAQAPWTLPSIVSMVTGRYPTELLSLEVEGFQLPPEEPSLGEWLQGLGYETAAFYGNPALHEGTGFGRGFDTFFAPPASFDWFKRHADDLHRRLLPWVEAHKGSPFFLYAHYLDPHDPYDNEDTAGGRSAYFPDYRGDIDGYQVHGVYGGSKVLADPEADVRQLQALYDSELTYVDRFVNRLLSALGPEVLANTLVILTSDHGEELGDHGGWKHGQSLYDEQIRVPFLVRWDGHLPAGRRIDGPVELLDIVPTLLAAAGADADPRLQGVNLLPALRGEGSLPRRAVFSQHLSFGPLRAAAVLDGRKLIFFDRQAPEEPADSFQAYLLKKDLGRFRAVELYDLEADPGEKKNLALSSPEMVRRMAPIIHHRLDRRLPGLRVVVGELAPGSSLVTRIEFGRPPEGWSGYFLGPEDRVSLEGGVLEIEWHEGPGLVPGRGVMVLGEPSEIRSIEAWLDGEELSAEAVRLAEGRPYRGGAILSNSLLAAAWPRSPREARVRIWVPADPADLDPAEEKDETRRRLESMGYLQP